MIFIQKFFSRGIVYLKKGGKFAPRLREHIPIMKKILP